MVDETLIGITFCHCLLGVGSAPASLSLGTRKYPLFPLELQIPHVLQFLFFGGVGVDMIDVLNHVYWVYFRFSKDFSLFNSVRSLHVFQ